MKNNNEPSNNEPMKQTANAAWAFVESDWQCLWSEPESWMRKPNDEQFDAAYERLFGVALADEAPVEIHDIGMESYIIRPHNRMIRSNPEGRSIWVPASKAK